MRARLNRLSDILLNSVIFGIGIASVLMIIFIVNNLSVTHQSREEVKRGQVYSRFNSCAIAQRSHRGSAALTNKEVDYCWNVAEKAAGFKVERYYGKDIE